MKKAVSVTLALVWLLVSTSTFIVGSVRAHQIEPKLQSGAFCKRDGPANYGLYLLTQPDVRLDGGWEKSSMCLASVVD